jgi:hypothetical protein
VPPDHVEVEVGDDLPVRSGALTKASAPSDPFSSPFQNAKSTDRAGRSPLATARANAAAAASTAAVPEALSSAPL